jgi:nucleotide-binding universal stress UspA family protein
MIRDTSGLLTAGPLASTPDPLTESGGRIVVGFDGSLASSSALTWAVHRANRSGGDLCIAGVVDDETGSMGQGVSADRANALAHLLSETADRLQGEWPKAAISTVLAYGPVSSALVAVAEPHDLVVIGSDKTGFARGRVYGSRSVQLAAAALGSIAVVPAVDLRLRGGVVVGVHSLESAARLGRTGALEAVARNSDLVLVHAIPALTDAKRRSFADEVLAVARAAAREECDRLEVRSQLAHRRPAEALLDLARDRALLLVGHSRTEEPLGVGGVLHDVLINANVPVVVLG